MNNWLRGEVLCYDIKPDYRHWGGVMDQYMDNAKTLEIQMHNSLSSYINGIRFDYDDMSWEPDFDVWIMR